MAEAEAAAAAARSEAAAAAEAELAGLHEQLAAREAAAAEMESTVAQMREDIARLDALNAELKAAMDAKVRGEGLARWAAWWPWGTVLPAGQVQLAPARPPALPLLSHAAAAASLPLPAGVQADC